MESTITVAKLKVVYICVYLLVPILWFGFYIGVWGLTKAFSLHSLLIGGLIFFFGTPVHELIHYYCFVFFSGVDRKDVKIKFDVKNFTAYVVCLAPTTSRRYRISAITPFIILGLLPSVCGLVFGIPSIGIAGVLAVTSCAGDLVMFALLMRINGAELVSRSVSRYEGRITRLGFVSAS